MLIFFHFKEYDTDIFFQIGYLVSENRNLFIKRVQIDFYFKSIKYFVKGSQSSINGDFDANQISNFTYDKRLYKECPYAGYYLSLCEERLECQLSLWTTFRSYLINEPHQDSPSFIESSWRKTLHTVNKTQSLNLTFSPQRLMLFKWCERALELPYDHPLLILYWQKFFQIYLDKDFQSSTTNGPNIKSPTLKIFTSCSQLNSMLKQMKKNLELTSEHFAYKCHDPRLANNHTTNFAFNELISKLYYALSLWIDETRLHDPNLYLPALPTHYEPNLLAKIYSKQTEQWTQFIDMSRLNETIESLVNSSPNSTKDRTRPVGLNREMTLFFEEEDRLVIKPIPIAQLGIRLQCALKEKYGAAIENILDVEICTYNPLVQKDQIQLVVNISEHLLRNIFKYNKEMINTILNHMAKLDDKLVNKLVIHLWHNEICEKYVQALCTSIINPMHQCSRPAMIKFVYEVATKRDQIRHDIKENRHNYEKLISNFLEFIPSKILTADNSNLTSNFVYSFVPK